jgi:hypothetical protein
MPSRFAWIDIDEASRRTMLDFIDQFRDQGTLDELGIGTIRDAFSEYFFPGTTTVQTRARYFLFVPWIYRRLEDKGISSTEIARRLRAGELELLEAMRDAGVGEGERLIGRQSGAALQRWPSNIYWAGLGRWGIRRFPGSQEGYHRWLDKFYRHRRDATEDAEGELGGGYNANWDPDPHFPGAPKGFPQGVTMDLRREDADYLVHRIRISCQNSLLTALLGDASALEADAIWMLPRLAELPDELQAQIRHAQWFAQVMHGASLLYYWSAASFGRQTERAEKAQALLDDWGSELTKERPALLAWAGARKQFWGSPALREVRVPDRTRRFVDAWIDHLAAHASMQGLWQSEAALRLIKDREWETKPGERARLWNSHQVERWDPSGAPGLLEYRWGIAQWMLEDILKGLNAEPESAVEG